MKLSVVIPALDEAGQIETAIASAASDGVEILVADGGSRDGTPERARLAGATIIETLPGRARQLGIGADAAQGDVILLLHADTRLPSGWDGAVRSALTDPDVVGGAFSFRFAEPGISLRVIEWGVRLRQTLFGLPYGDQALFVRRSVLDEIGGIPQVPIMEDLDLVRALKSRGRLALLGPAAVTSARRYRERGTLRTMVRNMLAACAWGLGLDRERVAAWYRR